MRKTTLTAVLALSLLGGCASEVTEWTPAEAPKKNIIQRTTLDHEVRYPAHTHRISKVEGQRLKGFIHDQLRYPDSVHVYLTEFGGRSARRVNDIVKQLRLAGVRQDNITVDGPQAGPMDQTGSGVMLMVERYLVIPPACQDWTRSMGGAEGEMPLSNMGCANTVNFGMMVADPRDLLNGKGGGLHDGTTMALGVERYRKDEVKQLMQENTTVGSASGGAVN